MNTIVDEFFANQFILSINIAQIISTVKFGTHLFGRDILIFICTLRPNYIFLG